MPALASFAVLLLFCIDGAIGDLVTSFVQNELTAFQMEPQSKAVKYGSSAQFSCNSSITPTGYPSYPNLIITWYKDGSAINIDERIVRQQQGGYSTLEIRSVTNSDAGCYQCSIKDGPSYEDMPCPSLLAGPASYMYITLSAPAYLVVISNTADITPPVAIVAAQNEPLLLECDFQAARPPDVAEWSFNGMNITKDICKNCIRLMNQKLLIQQMTKESAGNYSCTATWFGNNRKKAVYLVTVNNDTYSGTEVITFDHSPTAKNGSNYTLQCYTSPHPNTSVLWLRNGTIISRDHTLKLELIFGHSDGMYSCALTQDLLQHESGVINVLVPPVIYLGKISKTIYIQKHETKLLFCQASGNPYPTLSWYKNGKTLNNHTLVISYDNYGIFQCFANNTAGVTYETIRVLRYGVPNPPQNLHCTPKELSYMILGQAILSWTKPTYSGYPTVAASANIFYTVTVCTNGHAESQDRTSATLYKTIMQNDFYTYFYYISISINGTSSGKTFCRIFPPDRYLEPRGFETVNCSGNSALATWNVDPYNLFVTVNSVTIWGFCLNGTKTKAVQYFDNSYLGQETINLPILDMGIVFICLFGGDYNGNYDGYQLQLNIPTEVCNQCKDYPAPKHIHTDSIVSIQCNGNHVTLSWINVCLDERADIAITGICSNYSIDQMFEETRTESNGMVIFDVNINASGCFFQFNISSHLQNFSSGAVVCSFLDDDRKTDQFNLYVCNQGQTQLLVNGTNGTNNVTSLAAEKTSIPSTAAQSFILITIAGVVIIITATVASIIVISFRKVLSTQSTIEDRILNELFPSTTIEESDFLQNIKIDDSVSAITVIEHLTFPFVGMSPATAVKSKGTSPQESSNQSSVTMELELGDECKSNMEHRALPYGPSYDNSSGSSTAANSINSSGIE